jgi:hypothetical protein
MEFNHIFDFICALQDEGIITVEDHDELIMKVEEFVLSGVEDGEVENFW